LKKIFEARIAISVILYSIFFQVKVCGTFVKNITYNRHAEKYANTVKNKNFFTNFMRIALIHAKIAYKKVNTGGIKLFAKYRFTEKIYQNC